MREDVRGPGKPEEPSEEEYKEILQGEIVEAPDSINVQTKYGHEKGFVKNTLEPVTPVLSQVLTRSGRWKRNFIKAFRETGNLAESCKIALVSRRTVERHRKNNKRFATAYHAAMQDANDALSLEARRRALGYNEEYYENDKLVSYTKKYSERLLMFLMAANEPEKYRQNHKIEHSSYGGSPMGVEPSNIDWSVLSIEERNQLKAILTKVRQPKELPSPPET